MTRATLGPRTLVLGFALGGIATLALGTATPRAGVPADMVYRIEIDVTEKAINEMTKDGWEFVGYLGVSIRGDNADETLWRRPKE